MATFHTCRWSENAGFPSKFKKKKTILQFTKQWYLLNNYHEKYTKNKKCFNNNFIYR